MAKIIKFFLKPGLVRDVAINPIEPFNFIQFMANVRAAGYFANDIVHIPYDQIQCVFFAEPHELAQMLPLGQQPGETKQ